MLAALARLNGRLADGEDALAVLAAALEELVAITHSHLGLLAEAVKDPDGAVVRYVCRLADNPSPGSENGKPQGFLPDGMIFRPGKTLIGRLLRKNKTVVAESSPLTGTGLPEDHGPVHSFVGIPIVSGETLLGIVILINRPRGYDLRLVKEIRPLLKQMAYLCKSCVERRRANKMAESVRQAAELYFEPLAWTNTSGFVILWNRKAEEIFGLSLDAVAGRELGDVLGTKSLEISPILSVVRTQGYWTGRLTIRSRGECRPVEIHAVRQMKPCEGLTWIIRDVSQQLDAERKARESAARFEALAQNTRTGFWMCSLDGATSTYSSPAMTSIMGLPPGSRVDTDIWRSIIHPAHIADFDESRSILLAGGSRRYKYRIIRPDGQVRWVESYIFPVTDAAGSPYSLAGLLEDITEREELDASLRTALSEKDALLREIHHRVKNNLQLISSLLRLQGHATADAGAVSALRESRNRIDVIALLHEHLHKFEAQTRVDFAVYGSRLLSNVFRMNSSPPTEKHLKLDLTPLLLDSEKALRCGLILNELVTNALLHAFPGGKVGLIRVRLHVARDRALLTVQDNGIGLPRDFNPQTTHSLGIKLVQQLAKQLKGNLSFLIKEGTAISVGFPVEEKRRSG